MKKALQFMLIGLVLGPALMTVSQRAVAQAILEEGVVKLVAHDEQAIGPRMNSDIRDNAVIIGSPGQNYATIFVRDGKKWEKQAKILPGGGGRFGWSVSISRNTAIVGAPETNDGGDEAGSALIFVRSGKDWNQQVRLLAQDREAQDHFGETVSIDRNTVIIGVPRDDDGGKDSGAAFIFFRDGGSWKQQAKLVPSDLAGRDTFGTSVFVRGGTALVGANGHTHDGIRSAGAVYVFVREGERWRQQTKLTADDAAKADRFGSSVAMSAKTIIVGAPARDTENKVDVGAAYIFVPDGNSWKQQAKLTAKDPGKSFRFGAAVATTGNIAIVGAPGDDDPDRGAGSAYSFVRVDGVWTEKEKIMPEDAARDLNFGASISMSENSVAISAHSEPFLVHDGWPNGDGQAAYIFNSVEHFGTPPFAVEPFGLRLTTLGQVKHTALYQNFPNPFNPETWMPYRLAADTPVTLNIYNVQGQLIRELNLGTQKAGGYLTRETAAYWDGRDQVGEAVASGVYFYTLHVGPFQATRRMLILK